MYTWASLASLLMRHPELGPVVRPKLQVTQPNPFISNGRNKSYLIQHFNSTHNLETRPALNTFYTRIYCITYTKVHSLAGTAWGNKTYMSLFGYCVFLFHKMTNSKCSPDPNRVESESVSNKCEVVYIKEKNLDDYISKMEPNWRGNIYYQ